MTRLYYLFATLLAMFLWGCEDDLPIDTEPELELLSGFPEGFEAGSKSSYEAATLVLGSGAWSLDNALIGTSASDLKSDLKSVRIKEQGYLTMLFDINVPIEKVSLEVGVYGTDGTVSYEIWFSSDAGSSWETLSGPLTTDATQLTPLELNTTIPAGEVRFQIRNTSFTPNRRLNVDDFSLYTTHGSTGNNNTGRDNNLGLGNPSNAIVDIINENNYLMTLPQYAMSYNRNTATANWVSWHLNNAWLGDTPRQDDFRANPDLPSGWYQVHEYSYSGSGFDRGHLCPSADRDASVEDNSATFLMTNMVPQAPQQNQQIWRLLEEYCRSLAAAGNELYIVSGPRGSGGIGSNGGVSQTVDGGKVRVPSSVWKTIVVLPNGSNDLSRINASTRVIAVDIPNTQQVGNNSWGDYRISVDELEDLTGFDFFNLLPLEVQQAIESQVDDLPVGG